MPFSRAQAEIDSLLRVDRVNQNTEYRLEDVNRNLRGNTVTVRVWVENMPIFGLIYREILHESTF